MFKTGTLLLNKKYLENNGELQMIQGTHCGFLFKQETTKQEA